LYIFAVTPIHHDDDDIFYDFIDYLRFCNVCFDFIDVFMFFCWRVFVGVGLRMYVLCGAGVCVCGFVFLCVFEHLAGIGRPCARLFRATLVSFEQQAIILAQPRH
jgi:hypothetical protein